jgi:3-deoxy-manno-octulosonate cytidylyltransferase (CMP-KDO synthetase)
MKITAIIPARYASTRFEGKALADLMGKPMIQHVYERAIRASLVSEVVVATDDERIASAVKGFGGRVEMTSSAMKPALTGSLKWRQE